MRVAGIDCGTNSIRLLIADVEAQSEGGTGELRDVLRLMEVVRLGAGVDQTGRFADDALARTLGAVEKYAQLCAEHGVESVRFAATSATRDASNRAAFLDGVYAHLGVYPQVLSGEQEAATSFAGASSVLGELATLPSESSVLAIDLGGGSTELALGTTSGSVAQSYSMDVGCVRMFERHLRAGTSADGRFTEQAVNAVRRDVRAALDTAKEHVDLSRADFVIGLAGSVTTITAHALGLERYDCAKIHGAHLQLESIDAACNWLIASSTAERAAQGYMHPGRVDVISAGAIVWQEVVHRIAEARAAVKLPFDGVVTSEHDILDGLALWAAREPQQPETR